MAVLEATALYRRESWDQLLVWYIQSGQLSCMVMC
jgi:hypothetical protein